MNVLTLIMRLNKNSISLDPILVIEIMPNFRDVHRLQLVFKTSMQVAAITKQVAHHLTLAMEFIAPFTLALYITD